MEYSQVMEIPKIIHYCWFGGNPLPPMAKKCIASWRKYLPEYEIIEWNESNFDINSITYTRQAYESKKYAFVSDYARFWILEKYGGLYFDTDVEVIRPINDIISKGAFMGVESQNDKMITVAPGLGIGAQKGHPLMKQLVNYYEGLSFFSQDGEICYTNVVEHTTCILKEDGLINEDVIQTCSGITIYPKDYFCPIDYTTRKLVITDNTRTIHHYAESWVPTSMRIKNAFFRIIGSGASSTLVNIKKKIKGLWH